MTTNQALSFSHSRPYAYIRAFDHRLRMSWRYYRCIVMEFGAGSDEAKRVRENIRAHLIRLR